MYEIQTLEQIQDLDFSDPQTSQYISMYKVQTATTLRIECETANYLSLEPYAIRKYLVSGNIFSLYALDT